MQTEITLNSSLLKAGKREWIGLAILALAPLVVSMDVAMTFQAVPAISKALKPTGSELLWITDIFMFAQAGFFVIMASVGDRIGRRKLLFAGFLTFILASLLAAFSTSPLMLVAACAFLGFSGAIILPCTLSLIQSTFSDPRQRIIALGTCAASYAGGVVLGPLVAGLSLTYYWWGAIFLISVPVMFVLLALVWLIPESKNYEAKVPGFTNSLLLLAGVLLTVFGIKRMTESSALDSSALFIAAGGIVLSIFFVFSERRSQNPLFERNLLTVPSIASLAILFTALFCWSGLCIFLSQYLQLVLGLSPMRAGTTLLFSFAIALIGCMAASQLLRLMRRNLVIVVGCVVMLAGIGMLTQIKMNSGIPFVIFSVACLSLGCGLIVTMIIGLLTSSVPPERSGAALNISLSSAIFGLAFGVAILGSVGMATFGREMRNLAFYDVPMFEEFRTTFGSALDAILKLAPDIGIVFMVTVRDAFMRSFYSAAFVAGIMMTIATLIFVIVGARAGKN